MERVGFQLSTYTNMTGGIVALHEGWKPVWKIANKYVAIHHLDWLTTIKTVYLATSIRISIFVQTSWRRRYSRTLSGRSHASFGMWNFLRISRPKAVTCICVLEDGLKQHNEMMILNKEQRMSTWTKDIPCRYKRCNLTPVGHAVFINSFNECNSFITIPNTNIMWYHLYLFPFAWRRGNLCRTNRKRVRLLSFFRFWCNFRYIGQFPHSKECVGQIKDASLGSDTG
jgi:hypothetical protein